MRVRAFAPCDPGRPGGRAAARAVGEERFVGLAAQAAYVSRMEASGFTFGLTVGEAFVRGVRDIGYRSTGTALDELIDNALQAEAENVVVTFRYGLSDKKPDAIAVIDDGHGMGPTMIRLATIWGGTHRENERSGFGRYGYGLPSACVSQGRRFTIYSCPPGGKFHAVTMDVDRISAGMYSGAHGQIIVPEAEPAELPSWVQSSVQDISPTRRLSRGTAIVIEKLDRLTRTTASGLERHLVEHFGLTYRNHLKYARLWVQESAVKPIDPLFLTPGFRLYDLDADRAEALDPADVEVSDPETGQAIGTIHVRYALFPTTFASVDKRRPAWGRNANGRFQIMAEHNGIIFLRMGRQIDVVTRGLGAPFQNNDRYWKVEVDFSAGLDEEFGITTSKQRIDVSDRMWELLQEIGVGKAIDQLRRLNAQARARLEAHEEGYSGNRPSELAMAWSYQPAKPHATEHEYRVKLEPAPGAAFFRAAYVDGVKLLTLNTAHSFFTEVYAAHDSTRRLRNAIEVLLFTLADSESGRFDDQSREPLDHAKWSASLGWVLDRLSQAVQASPHQADRDERDTAGGPA